MHFRIKIIDLLIIYCLYDVFSLNFILHDGLVLLHRRFEFQICLVQNNILKFRNQVFRKFELYLKMMFYLKIFPFCLMLCCCYHPKQMKLLPMRIHQLNPQNHLDYHQHRKYYPHSHLPIARLLPIKRNYHGPNHYQIQQLLHMRPTI